MEYRRKGEAQRIESLRRVSAAKRIESQRPDLVGQVLALYAEGKGATLVARELGISSNSVLRIMQRAGVERDHSRTKDHTRKVDDTGQSEIVRRYANGESLETLGEEYGVSARTVAKYVVSAGGILRPSGTAHNLTEGERAEIGQWYEDGISDSEIARRVGVSQIFISRYLRSLGLPAKRSRAVAGRHGSWKGGRYTTQDGYIWAWMPADHPMVVMRRSNGYVLEHRLVMAESLGRPLSDRETVHHINGDRGDNRPENLQLRKGQHGKHEAWRCAACGSTNVVAVRLR